MDRRTLLNLGLAVAVAALAALAWFKPGASSDGPEDPLVFGALEGVARIAVSGGRTPSGTPVAPWALERRGDGWWITAPFVAPADAIEAETVITALREARSHARYAASALDATAIGLATPTLELAIDDAHYALGGTEPLNYRRYLRSGDTVHLVDDLLHYRLARDAAGFASKRLLPPGAKPVRIELPGRALARGPEGRWSVSPDDPTLGADAVVALVEAWSRAASLSVKARHDGVIQAVVRVTLEGTEAPLEFEVLTATDGVTLARRDLGLEYSLPDAAGAELLELRTALPLPAAAPAPQAPVPTNE